nr:MAG TPA: protein of unknown function (DUF4834) [Caudoviricetes sp.]
MLTSLNIYNYFKKGILGCLFYLIILIILIILRI